MYVNDRYEADSTALPFSFQMHSNAEYEELSSHPSVWSTTLEPSRHPTNKTADLEMVSPSTDNSSQVHSQDIPCMYVNTCTALTVVVHL